MNFIPAKMNLFARPMGRIDLLASVHQSGHFFLPLAD